MGYFYLKIFRVTQLESNTLMSLVYIKIVQSFVVAVPIKSILVISLHPNVNLIIDYKHTSGKKSLEF